jgi:hypothetical protein
MDCIIKLEKFPAFVKGKTWIISCAVRCPHLTAVKFLALVKGKIWIIITLFCFQSAWISAAFDTEPGNSRSLALGGCLSADPDPITGVIGNPAALSRIISTEIELGYIQLFSLPELATTKCAIIHPLAGGGIGLNLSSFGNDLYREIETEVSFGKSLGGLASLGVAVGYYWLSIQNYGSTGETSLSLGIQAKPLPNLMWGFWGRNLTESNTSNNLLPRETVTGFSYSIPRKFMATVDISKEPRYLETYKFGIEIFLNSYIVARAGMQHQPDRAGGGFGVLWNSWQLDYGAYSHWELGWTHSISLRWGIK